VRWTRVESFVDCADGGDGLELMVGEGPDHILRPAPKRRKRLNSRTAGPAETAAARIDWSNWLRSLSRRQRAIACTLVG
jgi:hypothetical protein